MACVDERIMHEIIDGQLVGEERRVALAHIRDCGKCASRMRVLMGLSRKLERAWSRFREEECLSPEVIYDYSDGTLPPDKRAKVEEHLKVCKICSLVLERGSWLAEEYARAEESLLKGSKERLGERLYEKVRRYLEGKFAEAQEILAKADIFPLQLQPGPVFRGEKAAAAPPERIPVVCKSDVVIVAVTGRDPRKVNLKLIDENGETVAQRSCSSEGIAEFFDIPKGYYWAEVIEN